ncbi:MAG: alpha/beta hydrolase [Planctomycetota bacterium]|nr:alpha/beta hydrolase [Planctomycetota bacterium]
MAVASTTVNIRSPNTDAAIPAGVVDVGSGPLVVFLHGLVGLNDHWDDVVQRISHRMRCVMLQIPLLDLRDDDCSIHGVANLTAAFFDQFLAENQAAGQSVEPPIVVGNSFGGHVALHLAIQRPELVRALVLAGASGLIEKSLVRKIEIRPSRDWLSEKIGELFHDRTKMREADLDRAFKELSHPARARAMVKLSRSARRNHLGEQLHRVQVPTLLIWGRQDIVTPPEAAQQFLQLIGNSRIDWYDQCGHAPMIESPERFADSMLRFCDELEK